MFPQRNNVFPVIQNAKFLVRLQISAEPCPYKKFSPPAAPLILSNPMLVMFLEHMMHLDREVYKHIARNTCLQVKVKTIPRTAIIWSTDYHINYDRVEQLNRRCRRNKVIQYLINSIEVEEIKIVEAQFTSVSPTILISG